MIKYENKYTQKICKNCGEKYVVKNDNYGNARKFCSRKCFGGSNKKITVELKRKKKEQPKLFQSRFNPDLYLKI